MWFPLNIKDYILKKQREENGCKIYISDLRNIWYKEFKNEEILETVKKLNPIFDAASNVLIEKALNLFSDDEKVKKDVKESAEGITLQLSSLMKVMQFKFELTLHKGDSDLLFKELTLPLLLLTHKLNTREKQLIEVIKKKEAEISEYKIENVTIKRTSMITQPFIEKELEDQEEFNSALLDVSKNPSQFFDKTCQNMLNKVTEVIQITEKEKLAQSSIIKQEQSSIDSNESPEKLDESETKTNSQVKEEVSLHASMFNNIGACNEIKKRKLQKNTRKLRI